MKLLPTFLALILVSIGVSLSISSWDIDTSNLKEIGREVYMGEGCIHCHSQYRRPVGVDPYLWGPPVDLETELESRKPVLFGNRRQGPDLSNAGLRRSRQWNKQHLMDPQALRPGSRMPSYAYLFSGDDPRGDALLDYLQELGQSGYEEWIRFVNGWTPSRSLANGSYGNGADLYAAYCIGCHGPDGKGDGPLSPAFMPAPRNLQSMESWQWIGSGMDFDSRRLELARLIKFGKPGTSMAGTEWLTDEQLADLVRFVEGYSYFPGE